MNLKDKPFSLRLNSKKLRTIWCYLKLNNGFRTLTLWSIVFVLSLFLNSCSQEKKTWTSLAWHNTLAHYNGYFIAREKMKEFEADQLIAYKDNYNKVLDIYPFPPLGSAAAANAAMEEIIKKASIPLQRHKNSKWLDECYQLVGQARFYKEDWENATQTFKFVNTKFKDVDSKHKAVIWLLITYTRMGDYSNAKSVIAYLKKETLSKNNLLEGALAFSYYYQKRKEYQKVADYLSMGVALMPRSRRKGRLSHALGQLQQKFKKDEDAYASYREVLRCKPSFELEFFTKLNMAQVVAITNEKQLKKIRKNFVRMTTDLKYEEYLDKVYYEMGCFEVKQNNLPKGLEYLRNSVKKSKGGSQKSYSYLKLGELHYSPLRSYVWAKNYYDSTMLGLDTADDNYKTVARRQKILTEFVTHYMVVEREDSLQRLAAMDSNQLFVLIDKMIKDENEKKEKADKAAKNLASGGSGIDINANSAFNDMKGGQVGGPDLSPNKGAPWYFGSLTAIANGRIDFKRKWGNRRLEDNWRRSTKQAEINDDQDAGGADSSKAKKSDDIAANPDNSKGADIEKKENSEKKEDVKLSQSQLRAPYFKDIPFTADQKKASHEKLQVALFEMGKIYDQKLEEPELAIEALERDVKDYPKFEKVPEALYNLCLIYRKLGRQADFDRCKDDLIKNHPESVFAKLIVNPNYLQENKQRNEIIAGLYKNVYNQYKSNQFIEASNGISNIRTQYPKSDFEDKLSILNALITAKTVDISSYKAALKRFMADYPKSNLQEFAQMCLKNAEMASGGATEKMPITSSDSMAPKPAKPVFNEELDKRQYFLAIIPTLNIPEAEITAAFSDFNTKFYPTDGLNVTSLPLNDGKHVMIKIQELPSKIQGMYYLRKVQEAGPFKKNFKNLKPVMVLATQENLQLLYSTKAVSDYVVFYTKNYNLSKELDEDIPAFGK